MRHSSPWTTRRTPPTSARQRSASDGSPDDALAVYPHEEGIGPNKYFDDVLYEIGSRPGGRRRRGARHRFVRELEPQHDPAVPRVIANVGDASQNLIQRYTVDKVDWRTGSVDRLGRGIVPPNNQGNATPNYNQMDNGEQPARMASATKPTVLPSSRSRHSKTATRVRGAARRWLLCGRAGDLRSAELRPAASAVDSRAASTSTRSRSFRSRSSAAISRSSASTPPSRRRVRILGTPGTPTSVTSCRSPVEGNPLFNGPGRDQGQGSLRTSPEVDATIFKSARTPELAGLINALVLGANVAPTMNRTDIAGSSFRSRQGRSVDRSGAAARAAGPHPTNPDDAGFSRLSIFGGDTLTSSVQPGFGNGRSRRLAEWPALRRRRGRHRGDGADQRSAGQPAEDRRAGGTT